MQSKPSLQQVKIVTLPERIEALSTKRQEIIRPILEHPREYVLLSIRALAQRLQTDPATIVRIVRGLGFSNYREFQRHLHDLSIAFATSLDTMMQIAPDAGMSSQIRNSLLQDQKNLQGLKNSLDPQRIAALAKRIYASRRILLLGGDLAATLAEYAAYHLAILGLPVWPVTSAGKAFHSVRALGKQDLVISISFRRGLRQTVECTRHARQRGSYCVGVCDTYVSPLARACDEVFLTSIESTSLGASYTAPVSLFNVILAACGHLRQSRTLAIVRELDEEQRKGSRWFNA
ncbi:MAG: MurR/RpiR family transcriptional regulator [Candidatus Acidiferrum sp.]